MICGAGILMETVFPECDIAAAVRCSEELSDLAHEKHNNPPPADIDFCMSETELASKSDVAVSTM